MTLPKGYDTKGRKADIDQYDEKILEAYNGKSTNFWRSFGIVVGFGIFFFFIILLPFSVLQAKNYEVTQQLIGTSRDIDNVNKNISAYQEVHNKVNNIENKTVNGANNLLSYITDLNLELNKRLKITNQSNLSPNEMIFQQAPLQQPKSNLTYPDCETMLNKNETNAVNQNAWANCNVIKRVTTQFNDFNSTLRTEIPTLLKNVHDPSVSDKVSAMSHGLDKLSKVFTAILHDQVVKQPNFWHTYQVKSELYSRLTNELNNFWDQYGSTIGTTLNSKNKTLTDKKVDLEAQRNITKSNKDELANQLKNIQFPFGNIPIGLNQAIVIFPLALAAGFAIYCYLLGDTIQLRRALYESYKKGETDNDIIKDLKMKVSLIAPLWIDPNKSIKSNIKGWAILLVPVVIFVVSWSLISYGWNYIIDEDIRTTFPYDKQWYVNFYTYLYYFSLIFIGYGIVRISIEWYRSIGQEQRNKVESTGVVVRLVRLGRMGRVIIRSKANSFRIL